MLSVNQFLPIVTLIIIIMAFPLVLQFVINSRVRGKHLGFIIEKGRPLTVKLLKIDADDYVYDGEDHWKLEPKLQKPVDYPVMFPKVLAGFQKGVWASLLMRGRHKPLNWEDPLIGDYSSKEIGKSLDPHLLVNLMGRMGEEGAGVGFKKGEKMLLYMAVGASIIAVVVLFYVITRLGGIEQAIQALRAIIRS